MKNKKNLLSILFFLIITTFACNKNTKQLNVVFSYAPLTYMPNKRSEIVTSSILYNFYDPLVKFDADFRPHPGLAEYWNTPDSLTWIFYLRKNVHFVKGKHFTSEDVIYTFNTIKEDSTSEYKTEISDIDTFYAIDSFTVKFRLKTPAPTFLEKIGQILILQRNCSDRLLRNFSCGTGALKFLKKDTHGNILAVPNNDYFGKKIVFNKILLFVYNKCPCEYIRDTKNNYYLYTITPPESCVIKHSLLKIAGPLNSIRYIGINTSLPILKNKYFRKALYLSIDRYVLKDSVEKYYGITVLPSYELAIPNQIGYTGYKPENCCNRDTVTMLLKKSKYTRQEITMLVATTRLHYAQVIKRQLLTYGIYVRIKTLTPHEIFHRVMETGNFQTYLLGLIPQSINIYSTMEAHLHTRDTKRRLGIKNYFKYSDFIVDSMIEKVKSTIKQKKRKEMLINLEKKITDDLPLIPVLYESSNYFISRNLSWKPRIDRYILLNEIIIKE